MKQACDDETISRPVESDALLLLEQELSPTAQVRAGEQSNAHAVVDMKGGKRRSLSSIVNEERIHPKTLRETV